jgi:hypothetical protein
VKAMEYVREQLWTREIEREKRDREFWIAAFGGDTNNSFNVVAENAEDEAMSRSPLAR